MTDSLAAAAADDVPPFAPVPLRARHDGWTPERQQRFIAALAHTGSVAAAARGVGKSAATAYRLRERTHATAFRQAWDTAQQMASDRAWELVLSRGLEGYTAPRFYRGRQVGTVHQFDTRLTIAALRLRSIEAAESPALTPAQEAELAWLLTAVE